MLELLTPQQMAEADRRTVTAGTPIATLMDEAGHAVANLVASHHAFGAHVVVLAGPGDNGGDAYVAARVLDERGYRVRVVPLGAPPADSAAGRARLAYRGPLVECCGADFGPADAVVDGLFGGGLSRPLDGDAAALVAAAHAARARGAKIYAIDLPSGVDGATGALSGPAVVADRTITFARRRVGHLLLPGRTHCGAVSVAQIGIADATIAAVAGQTFANEPALWRDLRPQRADGANKYTSGHAVVVSGPMAATGAARLAARAALRAGAGLVTLASAPDALMVNACHLTTVMLAKIAGPDELSAFLTDRRLNTVCLGPGLPPDERTRALCLAALSSGAAVVLDAGAISAWADQPNDLFSAVNGKNAVLTPHEGEFARVFGRSDGDKLTRTRSAAAQCGAVVVLKGADTVIASPNGRAAINANAPPWLATAGTGDVLSGIVTAFLAQGAPPFEAAAMGVWLHGDAAHRSGPALIAEDLVEAVRPAMVAFNAL